MHRFNSTLHYAIQCYEGMKAYKNSNDEIRLFRPECNMYRFKETSKALCLPDFDGGELLRCIERLVKVDKRWIPTERGFSLYIRPAHISMEETLGVKEASRSQIFVVLNPVGPYYPEGFKPISLYCETEKIRSAPLGSGNFKMGWYILLIFQQLRPHNKLKPKGQKERLHASALAILRSHW